MGTIHLTLMNKGGVGKSFVSSVLTQYLMEKSGGDVLCADTDPTTPTFSSHKAFKAHHINIMTPDMNIDRETFDDLLDMLISHEGDAVVDNGASSFLPLMAYICQEKVVDFLLDSGKKVVVHAPIVGGQGMRETVNGLALILDKQPAPAVIWENELFGPVVHNGKGVTEMPIYRDNKPRVSGVVRLQQRSADTFGKTLNTLTSNRMTFKEAAQSDLFKTMALQRLIMVQREIYQQLDKIEL